jgi:hypothetical protein
MQDVPSFGGALYPQQHRAIAAARLSSSGDFGPNTAGSTGFCQQFGTNNVFLPQQQQHQQQGSAGLFGKMAPSSPASPAIKSQRPLQQVLQEASSMPPPTNRSRQKADIQWDLEEAVQWDLEEVFDWKGRKADSLRVRGVIVIYQTEVSLKWKQSVFAIIHD